MYKISQWYYDRRKHSEGREPKIENPTAKETKAISNETEPTTVKYPYPKGVYFIFLYVIFSSLCGYSIMALLALYLKNILLFNVNHATALNHAFILLSFTTPLLSAYISDSYLGKFRTLVYSTIMCVLGTSVLAVSAFPTMPHRLICFIGLFLIGTGGGAIKSLIPTLGGDQFKLPEQTKQLSDFFALFYLCVNLSACVATVFWPILRKMHCLKMDSCYPLAFGLSTSSVTIALVVLCSAQRLYVIKKPDINIVSQVFKCISHAIVMRRKLKKIEKKNHWLDYASDKYDPELITDIKALLSVIIIFTPCPFFWALYEQQTSTWVFQAERMNGSVGKLTILPEHIQVVNPVLIIILVPFFEFAVYPLCNKIGILKTPLQKFGLGLLITSFAFAASAIVAYYIQVYGINNVHILWLLPQLIMLSVAEVLLNVQALNFGYTQAPTRLKAVVAALWLLTTAIGNLIIILVAGVSLFSNMMYELIFFSGLILLDFFLFLFLAIRYKYHTYV